MASGDLDLWTMKPDGSDKKQITKTDGYDGGPVFSRDAQKVVWRANHPQTPETEKRYHELLSENLMGRIRLSQLAQECGLSISHFARSFKASFGVSSHRWLVQRRIERSQELLIHTGESLVDIADQAGFADQAAFTRTFHQIVGMSPGRWRRDHQRR